jgi:hypothetical protein
VCGREVVVNGSRQRFRLNKAQRHHFAQTCQILANAQLGYRMFAEHRVAPLGASVVLFLLIEAAAHLVLRGVEDV